MGHAELRAEGSDYDDLSQRASRVGSPTPETGLSLGIPPSSNISSAHASFGSSRIVSPLASPGNSQVASRSESPVKGASQ